MNAKTVTRAVKGMTLRLDDIEIPSSVRPYNATAVVELSKSIAAIGLQSAPTVIERDGRYVLVAGRHRIEALRLLKHESVLVRVVDFDDLEARLWTIVENLHRAELTAKQRYEQIAEYARLAKEKREASGFLRKLRTVSRGRRPRAAIALRPATWGLSAGYSARPEPSPRCRKITKEAARNSDLMTTSRRFWSRRRRRLRGSRVLRDHRAARKRDPRPLATCSNISAGELARWIKITTPNDRPHVIRVLEQAAAILRDEMGSAFVSGAA